MVELADAELLQVWESARHQPAPQRALALLERSHPDTAREQLAGLSLGEVGQRLLQLLARSFGPRMACVSDCPACGESFEFELDAHALARGLADGCLPAPGPIPAGDCRGVVHFRLPTLAACMAAAHAPDAGQAHRLLLQWCLSLRSADGTPLPHDALDEPTLAAAAAQIEAAAQAGDIELALQCPACKQTSDMPLDVALYLWSEIESRARALLAEVDALASRYGWREAEILAMSRVRRRHYLDMALA
jgi:hypothetical protein